MACVHEDVVMENNAMDMVVLYSKLLGHNFTRPVRYTFCLKVD